MTNMILRLQLIALLQAANRVDILDRIAEPGELLSKQKIYRFDGSWAKGFYKRHMLVARVATTKMREEVPAKYAEKIRNYQLILSLNIVDHNNVPDALNLNMDETNTLFVPQISRTRCLKHFWWENKKMSPKCGKISVPKGYLLRQFPFALANSRDYD